MLFQNTRLITDLSYVSQPTGQSSINIKEITQSKHLILELLSTCSRQMSQTPPKWNPYQREGHSGEPTNLLSSFLLMVLQTNLEIRMTYPPTEEQISRQEETT